MMLALLISAPPSAGEETGKRLPAFPGAEGFGAYTPGGRGGRIIEVTNLDAQGPGSLQAACSAKGPRIVVFRVGGVIPRSVVIREPYITIAGQTAPGDGICIRGVLNVNADNVIVQHLRVRPGDHPLGTNPEDRDCIAVRGNNVIIDHCSASWGVDENVQVYGPYGDVTIQWCITSEALCDSIHPKGPHGMGMILGCAGMSKVSVHHCLFAHNQGRNPLIAARSKGAPIYDVRNNVAYARFQPLVQILGHPRVNVVGNVLKRGQPSSEPLKRHFGISRQNPYTQYGAAEVYVEDNIWAANPEGARQAWTILAEAASNPNTPESVLGFTLSNRPIPVEGVTTERAARAYESVLRHAGCTRPVRDVVDARIVAEVRASSGSLIDSQDYVGGWPTYASAEPTVDSDHDGMPDAWEKRHGFILDDPKDGPRDRDGDGYTNVEEYLNLTDPGEPDSGGPVAQRSVRVQAGNKHLRGAAARNFGRELLAERQKANCTLKSAETLRERVGVTGRDVADVLGFKMVRIEPGEFELWKIRFRITESYLLAATEVTQSQWKAVMGTRPWAGQPATQEGPDVPATYVSYIDAQAFVRRLNAYGGPEWRLPTQAEWRLASCGGTEHQYGFEEDPKRVPEYAFCCGPVYEGGRTVGNRSPIAPQEVAQLKPNPFGLYDIAGNVREWVSDYASHHYFTRLEQYGADRVDPAGPESGTERTVCGGHFRYVPQQVLYRRPFSGHRPHYRGFGLGFRLARDAP